MAREQNSTEKGQTDLDLIQTKKKENYAKRHCATSSPTKKTTISLKPKKTPKKKISLNHNQKPKPS
jgi:hypothetical protein